MAVNRSTDNAEIITRYHRTLSTDRTTSGEKLEIARNQITSPIETPPTTAKKPYIILFRIKGNRISNRFKFKTENMASKNDVTQSLRTIGTNSNVSPNIP